MAHRDIVVIGGSAGGLDALRKLSGSLLEGLDASILAVLHTSKHAESLVADILNRESRFIASHPADKTQIRRGHLYVAPPDLHMVVEDGCLRVTYGPRENHHRPAIDPLFRSAAIAYGPRVIGIVLSGLIDDGTAGLMAVRAMGGAMIVQDPKDALFPSMPESALREIPEAQVATIEEMPDLLLKLNRQEVSKTRRPLASEVSEMAREAGIAEFDMPETSDEQPNGRPSQFACPDCGGVLWELADHGFLRFRCRVGHSFTPAHLDSEQRRAVESALWEALRALEERASLYSKMARTAGSADLNARYEEISNEKLSQAKILREFLLQVNKEEAPTSMWVPTSDD